MKLPQKTLGKLIALKPVSIAVTGSSASGEAGAKSDIEVIVVFLDSNYVGRSELKKLASGTIRLYPFRLSEMRKFKSPHPFPVKFYFWWLAKNAKTVWGKAVVENFSTGLLKKDLREVLAFERGVALSAMHSFRNGDKKTAEVSFSKSCLFGTVAGVGLSSKTVPSRYGIAVKRGIKNFPKYAKLIQKAERVRVGGANTNLEEQDIFGNLEYLHHITLKM